jgi:CCR4-NOT transcription complex subunit 3
LKEPDFFETYGDDDIYEDLDLDSLGAAVQVGLSSDQDGMLDDSVASDQIKEATNGNGSSSLQPPSTSSTNRSAAKTPKKSASCSAITGIGRPGMVKPIELKTSVMTSGKSVSKVDDDQILSDDKGRTRSASSRGKIVVPSDELLSVERKPSIETKTPPDLNKERSNTPTTSTSGNSGFDVSVLMNDERIQLLQMVDESFSFIPESRDSEKVNKYVPRNTYPTSASFPSTPMSLFENSNFYEKLDLDTLFFIFYYQQGSYQQFLAAKELKRRTWGYHKKYKTWFKRHEEPQITGEDYEQGTFVYFDYETGWCQRIKTEFTFEYSYLEDELL